MSRSPRILLVDDNAAMTTVCCRALNMTGDYEIREVNSGSEAVKVALEFRPDLILLDVVMPAVSGEAILAEIRKFKELGATHVAFLTGVSPSQVQLDENTSFIGKPIQIPELVAVVESMLARLPDRIA